MDECLWLRPCNGTTMGKRETQRRCVYYDSLAHTCDQGFVTDWQLDRKVKKYPSSDHWQDFDNGVSKEGIERLAKVITPNTTLNDKVDQLTGLIQALRNEISTLKPKQIRHDKI